MNRAEFKEQYDSLTDDATQQRKLVQAFYKEHTNKSSWEELCDQYFLQKHYSAKKIVSTSAATKKGIARSAGGAHNALSTLIKEKDLKSVLSFVYSEILTWHLANSLNHWRYYLIPIQISVSDTKITKVEGGVYASTRGDKGERIFGLNPHALLGHYGGDTNTNETYFIMGSLGNWMNAEKVAAKLEKAALG